MRRTWQKQSANAWLWPYNFGILKASNAEVSPLKKSNVFTILLITVILLQSFVAMSASTTAHQLDIEHLKTEHVHTDDFQTHGTADNDTHDINDCHHCGHCSGNHTAWIVLKTPDAKVFSSKQNRYHKLSLLPINLPESLYRPPIT